jgi:hypothetical protein
VEHDAEPPALPDEVKYGVDLGGIEGLERAGDDQGFRAASSILPDRALTSAPSFLMTPARRERSSGPSPSAVNLWPWP